MFSLSPPKIYKISSAFSYNFNSALTDLLLLLQMMLLLDNRHENREYKNISAATCLSYAESIRNTYDENKKALLLGDVEYLDEAFPSKIKFLRKNNVPVVGVCGRIALEQGVDPKDFRAFICDFSNGVYPEYEEASGSGNVKFPKVVARLRCLFLAMCKSFGWNVEEVAKPFAAEIPLYGSENEGVDEAAATDSAAAENSNLTSGVPIEDGSVVETPGYGAPEGEDDGGEDRG